MTPRQIKTLRQALKLTPEQFGNELGYRGNNIRVTIHRLENGQRSPGGAVALRLNQLADETNLGMSEPQMTLPEAVDAIMFAVQIDDHYDRLSFLESWIVGDITEWKEEYSEWQSKQ